MQRKLTKFMLLSSSLVHQQEVNKFPKPGNFLVSFLITSTLPELNSDRGHTCEIDNLDTHCCDVYAVEIVHVCQTDVIP